MDPFEVSKFLKSFLQPVSYKKKMTLYYNIKVHRHQIKISDDQGFRVLICFSNCYLNWMKICLMSKNYHTLRCEGNSSRSNKIFKLSILGVIHNLKYFDISFKMHQRVLARHCFIPSLSICTCYYILAQFLLAFSYATL